MKRFFLGLTLLVIALIQTAPAWLLDLSLQSVTNGRIRLTQAHGRIWHGSGTLARAAEARTFTAWLPVDWSFEPAALRQGQLQWKIRSSTQPLMLLAVSPRGINLQTLKLTLPAVALGDIAPHPVFQTIGWRGKFTLNTQNYQCTWAGVCTGKLDAIWHDAGVDILPTHNFGDYNIQINAQAGDIGITLSSAPNSAIAAEGSGRVTPKEGLRFTGTLKGDPDTVGRLPNIMDRNAKQTTTPGVVELHFP